MDNAVAAATTKVRDTVETVPRTRLPCEEVLERSDQGCTVNV
jgi:hypothetical protein